MRSLVASRQAARRKPQRSQLRERGPDRRQGHTEQQRDTEEGQQLRTSSCPPGRVIRSSWQRTTRGQQDRVNRDRSERSRPPCHHNSPQRTRFQSNQVFGAQHPCAHCEGCCHSSRAPITSVDYSGSDTDSSVRLEWLSAMTRPSSLRVVVVRRRRVFQALAVAVCHSTRSVVRRQPKSGPAPEKAQSRVKLLLGEETACCTRFAYHGRVCSETEGVLSQSNHTVSAKAATRVVHAA